MFNWFDHFNNVKENAINTNIVKCCVCGDLLYNSNTTTTEAFGWKSLNDGSYICLTCSNGANNYITKQEAIKIDRINRKIFGSKIDKAINRPYRNCYTWLEHKKYNAEYKDAL